MLHGPVRAPDAAGVGKAKVMLSFDSWKEARIARWETEVAVTLPKPGPVRVAVSKRLRATLAFPEKKGQLTGLAFAKDGQRLAAIDFDKRLVQVWDAVSHKAIASFDSGRIRQPRELTCPLAFSPDGKIIVTAFVDVKFEVEEAAKGKEAQSARVTGEAELRYWDAATGKLRDKRKLPAGTMTVVFSEDGSTATALEVVSVKENAFATRLHVLDPGTGKPRHAFDSSEIDFLGLTYDGKRLITLGKDKSGARTFQLLDLEGKELESVPRQMDKGVRMSNAPDLTPDGKTLVGGDVAGTLFVWDLESRKLRWKLKAGEGKLRSEAAVAVSSDSRTAAVAVMEEPNPRERDPADWSQPRIILWDLATGKRRDTLVTPPGYVATLTFSPDGRTLAAGGLGSVWLWDVADLQGRK